MSFAQQVQSKTPEWNRCLKTHSWLRSTWYVKFNMRIKQWEFWWTWCEIKDALKWRKEAKTAWLNLASLILDSRSKLQPLSLSRHVGDDGKGVCRAAARVFICPRSLNDMYEVCEFCIAAHTHTSSVFSDGETQNLHLVWSIFVHLRC